MSVSKAVVLCCVGVFLLLFQAQVNGESEVTLVTRNDTDSFRVGQDGCKGNESICTSVGASCNQDDGLCLCYKYKYPHFRNPVITTKDGGFVFGDSYGCVKEEFIRVNLSSANCIFKPFQLLPNQPEETWTEFAQNNVDEHKVVQCTIFQSVATKNPSSNTLNHITWIDKTYIDYSVPENGKFRFKWKKSVTAFEGLMIKMGFYCKLDNGGYTSACLEGKVLGTWKTDKDPDPVPTTTRSGTTIPNPSSTPATPESTKNTTVSNSTAATPSVNNTTVPNTTITQPPTSSNHSVLPSSAASEGDSDVTLIASVAAAAAFVLIIALLILLWCCFVKRRKGNRKNSPTINGDTTNDALPMPLYDESANVNSYASVDEMGLTNSGPTYSEPEKRKIERIEVNGVEYAVSDKKKNAKQGLGRVEVNGAVYTLPEKTKSSNAETNKELPDNYMNPNKLDLAEAEVDEDIPITTPTEYASIDPQASGNSTNLDNSYEVDLQEQENPYESVIGN